MHRQLAGILRAIADHLDPPSPPPVVTGWWYSITTNTWNPSPGWFHETA